MLRSRRRAAGALAGAAIGVFALFVAALLLLGDRFADRVGGVPLGIWLALLTIAASFAVVVAHARLTTRRAHAARAGSPRP